MLLFSHVRQLNIQTGGMTGSRTCVNWRITTPIAHEGELDPRLQFNDAGSLQIGSVWNLPSSYITGLCVRVIVAPENTEELIDAPLGLTVFGHQLRINELWGAESRVIEIIAGAFRNPNLFD